MLGSGPHVLRGLELYKRRLIAYSLGNLAGWHTFDGGGSSSITALLTVALDARGRFYTARITPFTLDGAGVPHRDRRGAATTLIRRLSRADFPRSRLRISRDGLITARA